MKKLCALILTLCLFLPCVMATAEDAESVNLVYYYCGNGIQKDTQLVNDKINELLPGIEGLEHTTITLMPCSGSEYSQKLLLALTAGEQVDIVSSFSASNNIYDDMTKGTYICLDELVALIPDTVAEMPAWVLDYGKLDGKQYLIPTYQQCGNQRLFTIPTEYLPCLMGGDKDAAREVLWHGTQAEKYQMILDYARAVRAAYPEKEVYIGGLAGAVEQYGLGPDMDALVTGYANMCRFEYYPNTGKVGYRYTTDFMLEAYQATAAAYEEGLIPEDILTLTASTMSGKNMLNDVAFCWQDQQGVGTEEAFEASFAASYGFDVTVIQMDPTFYIGYTYAAGGNLITATCDHPEEAIRWIDLLCSKKGTEIYNTLVYGIEGTHYEKIDDTHIRTLEYDSTQGGADTSYAAMKWNLGNTFNAYLNQGCVEGQNEYILNVVHDERAVFSDLIGFRPNLLDLESELSQVSAVTKEYYDGLIKGVMGDGIDAYYEEYLEKVEAAGVQKVIDALQSQIDAFLAAKGA